MTCPDGNFDTVTAACVFCSIANQGCGPREAARVVRRDGHLLFSEHARPHNPIPGANVADLVSPQIRAHRVLNELRVDVAAIRGELQCHIIVNPTANPPVETPTGQAPQPLLLRPDQRPDHPVNGQASPSAAPASP